MGLGRLTCEARKPLGETEPVGVKRPFLLDERLRKET